ncbi:MAG: hypothetical protein Q8904_14700 [Bacteroidota bacterium]|nr:hypothetical protein [Bacteroidota bacterium]
MTVIKANLRILLFRGMPVNPGTGRSIEEGKGDGDTFRFCQVFGMSRITEKGIAPVFLFLNGLGIRTKKHAD